MDLHYEIFNNNENSIKYYINSGDEQINIFGNTFVNNNNKDNCSIIYDKK